MLSNPHRMVSRATAFGEQGVALKYPSASWSGVRADDGMVLFAVRAEDVIADATGSRCLLWASFCNGAYSRASAERLQHCIRALHRGIAEGMLAFENGTQIDATTVLCMRVERYRGEYWAKWDSAVLEFSSSLQRPAPSRGAHALAAACQ